MVDIKSRIDYWVDLAKYDFETAQAMLKTKRYLYVGFMCHQSIEKILKAYYVFKFRENPIKTHKLTYLTIKTNLENELSEKQKDFIDEIEPLNIEARYPTYKKALLQSLNDKRCEILLKNTENFIKWIIEKIY